MSKFYLSILSILVFICLYAAYPIIANGQKIDSIKLQQSETEARSLGNKWNQEANSQAIKIYLEVADNWIKIKNLNQAASCMFSAGRLTLISGDRTTAENNFRSALKILANSPNNALKARLFSELSQLAIDAGNISQSRLLFEKSLELANQSGDPSSLGSSYYSAGQFYYYVDETEKALISFQKSADYYSKTEDLSEEAKTIVDLSYVYLLKSNFRQSLISLDTALSKYRQIGDMRGEALTYKATGSVYKQMYDYQKAIFYLQKAEELFPEGLDLDQKAMLYNWFGSLYEDYGNWNLSLDYRQKAYEIFISTKHIYGQMATLISLARLQNLLGDNPTALRYIEQADKFSQILRDKFYAASIEEEKSNIYLTLNDLEKSASTLKKALKLYDQRLYQRQIARVNNKLGSILEQQNRFAEAAFHFDLSLELSKKVKDKLTESQTLFNLARLSYSGFNTQTALKLIETSIKETESSSSGLLNSKLKSLYLSNVYERYELYIKILMKSRQENFDFAPKALQIAENSKAQMFLEKLTLSEAEITKDADTETVEREKQIRMLLNSKADALTDLLSANAQKIDTDKVDSEIRILELELEEITTRLKEVSPVYSAIKNPAPFDVAAFQRNVLDEDSLLLEFSFGAEESYLWTVGKSEVESYVLPARVEIESRIEKLRELLKERELKQGESVEDFQTRIGEAEKQYTTISKELSRQLFGQVGDKLGRKRLIIVPDGELNYFPVSALPSPNSDSDEPILLTNETIYEPSAQTLSVLTKSKRQTSPDAKNLLIFSDPVFTGDDARFFDGIKPAENTNADAAAQTDKFRFIQSLNNLPRLSASKDESETITNIVGASEADNYSGFAATRENLLNVKAENYRILHFATHGLMNEQRPELSGIVLSRFDEKGAKLNEFFRIQDIYGLNLNADLVVLSACETGIGKQVKGEGLMSLNNAFLQTGAKSVMASLWKVEDGATLELMKNFYGAMEQENLTPSQSLRKAQIKLRENPQYRSPFYWAAFTVQGDYRSVPQISRGFGEWLYGLPFLPLSFFGFYAYRKKKLLRRKAVGRAAA